MKPLFLFFSILYILNSHNIKQATSTQHHSNITDLESLLAFKAQVTDPEAFLSTNWTTNTSFCNWFGVSCSRRHKQRVTSISLFNMSLKEYIWTGRASKMGDVYSFGILLLETFTGKRPSDGMFGEESSLREWVRKDYPSGVFEVLDSNLVKDNSSSDGSSQVLATVHQCLSDVIELGLLCSNHSPTERISMLEVVSRLRKIKLDYLSNI